MTRRVETVNGNAVTISPLEPPAADFRHSAIMLVSVRDEVLDRAPRAQVFARLDEPRADQITARVVDAGLIVVTGKPRVFDPTIATTSTLALTISAPRFLSRSIEIEFACARRTLTAPATASILTLDSAASLIANQKLLMSTEDGMRVEFAEIGALGPGANDVTLVQVLNSPFPVGSIVQPLPMDLSLDLHRAPTTIAGRVLKRAGGVTQPLANAIVTITKIWRELPSAGSAPPPELPVPGGPVPGAPWDAPIAALDPPCYFDFAAASNVEFEDRPVDPTMPEKTLLDEVPELATQVRLSDAQALNANDVIAFDADDAGRAEILEVESIVLSGTAADWARITLKQPLARSHRRGAVVRRLSSVAPAITRALNYESLVGDAALMFDASGVTGTHQVRIASVAPPVRHSFHRLTVYSVRSDLQGFYRLPPIARAGKLEISAQDSGSAAKTAVEIVPEYESTEMQLDLTVS